MGDSEIMDMYEKEKKLFYRLQASFIAFCASIAMLLMPVQIDSFFGVALIVLAVSKLTFLYYIGCLAAEANKSRLLWIIGSLIAFPLGTLIAFFRMRRIAIGKFWI